MKPLSPQPLQQPRQDAGDEGVRPALAELLALRATSLGGRAARKGRHGMAGPAPSALRGRGMEYAESREYVAGDDVRHIDWRLTARSGKTHTKLFQAERERLTLVVADTAPGLYFGTRVRFKSVQAARAGAVAAWLAQRQGDRVAALRGSSQEPPVAPASGTRGVLRVLDALARWYGQPPDGDEGLDFALEQARRLLRPGSRLVVLADPAEAAAIAASRWSGLAAHHEVTVVLLVDPLEMSPPHADLPFVSEGGRLELALGSPAVRQRWQGEFVAPVESLLAALPARGASVHVLSTTDASDAWLQPSPLPELAG